MTITDGLGSHKKTHDIRFRLSVDYTKTCAREGFDWTQGLLTEKRFES